MPENLSRYNSLETRLEAAFETEIGYDVLKIDNKDYSGTYGPCEQNNNYTMTHTRSYRWGHDNIYCSNHVSNKVLGATGESMR